MVAFTVPFPTPLIFPKALISQRISVLVGIRPIRYPIPPLFLALMLPPSCRSSLAHAADRGAANPLDPLRTSTTPLLSASPSWAKPRSPLAPTRVQPRPKEPAGSANWQAAEPASPSEMPERRFRLTDPAEMRVRIGAFHAKADFGPKEKISLH